MKKYQELEQKIKELQAEVDRLKKEEQLPGGFYRDRVLAFLNDPYGETLDCAFDWNDTPQGYDYWNDIDDTDEYYGISKDAIIQLQKWVILSYQQQHGD